jgi:hypothetical protein
MAHLIDVRVRCDGCGRRDATHALYNSRNAPVGNYCARCKDRALEEIRKKEQPRTT